MTLREVVADGNARRAVRTQIRASTTSHQARVGEAADAVFAAQLLDQHADIVEYAKAGGAVTRGVVQPADRHKCAWRLAAQRAPAGIEARADHVRCRLVHAGKRRRIAVVQIAAAGLRLRAHARDILLRMETEQLGIGARDRRGDDDAFVETACLRLAPEGVEPIGAERVAVAETVAGEGGTVVDAGGHAAIIASRFLTNG